MLRFFKISIILLSVSCLILSSCATVIEWDMQQRDQFDGTITQRTESWEIASNIVDGDRSDYLCLSITVINGNKYFLNLATFGNFKTRNRYIIRVGDNAYLRLKNDSLLNITNPKDALATDVFERIGYYTLEYWRADTVYPITYNDLNKLKNSNFIAARIETDGGNIDYSITEVENKRIKQLVSLALSAEQ